MKKYRNVVVIIVFLYGIAHYFIDKQLKIYVSIMFLMAILALLGFTFYKEPNKIQIIKDGKTEFISISIIAIILGLYFIIVN